MISKNLEKAINAQIIIEGYSSHLYLAMASWCEGNGMAGSANFLYRHAEEERLHMLKFIHYLNSRGGKAVVPSIEEPPKNYKDIFAVFKDIMKHEVMVTAAINELVDLTLKEKDFNTNNFLQWYVGEQVEEEGLFQGIQDKIKLLGKEQAGFYLIDKELEALALAPAQAAV
ncbi:MAG: ferritin [Bacteroidota bacterium]